MKYIFFLMLPLLMVSKVEAQINSSKLNKLFAELEANGEFNGSVIIAKGSEVLFKANIGFADFENKVPINDSTRFELASMGKQFTAMAIMLLQESDQIEYDNSIQNYFPELPYKEVTVRHLLTMSSGIPDYLNFSDSFDGKSILNNKDLIAFYNSKKPVLEFTPGDQFKYSNINYVLLAEIIQLVSKKTFAKFLEEHIFIPLEMTNTKSYTTRFTKNDILTNYAYQYIKKENQYIRTDYNESTKYIIATSGIEGDGSIVSTNLDLLKWTLALTENKLVSKETLTEAYTPYTLNNGDKSEYGFGIYLKKNEAWHWGGWPGIQTSYTRYIDKDLVVIYLKNVESRSWNWLKKFNKLTNK